MKRIIIISISLLPWLAHSQTDSSVVTLDDICPDLFRTSPTDSTYQNYYVTEHSDTFYFENKRCAILPQLTDPGTTIWRTKTGYAHGFLHWTYFSDGIKNQISGTFENGRFISGTCFEYYQNGMIKKIGEYENGIGTGIWTWYNINGSIDFQGEMINGVCESVDDPQVPKTKKEKANRIRL